MKLIKYTFLALTSLIVSLASTAADIEFLNKASVHPTKPPFSEAVRAGDTLYLSGKLGTDPETGKLAPGGIKPEARQTMENIKASLERYGYSMNNVVKCTVMLADISEWGAFNEVYRDFFAGDFPARSAFAGSGLALGARVEVECIAYVGK